MPCPICRHTMQRLGLDNEQTWWCPRCGCLKTMEGESEKVFPPALIERVRQAVETTDARAHAAFRRTIEEAVGLKR